VAGAQLLQEPLNPGLHPCSDRGVKHLGFRWACSHTFSGCRSHFTEKRFHDRRD
jgi:hypothetical protein